ncbi:MAG TPA: hypothetical protein VK934_05585 [Fimbriimonas sp.]|nr:hypothetical protein [Fimbriimonas sp.]
MDPGTPNVVFSTDLSSVMTELIQMNGGTKVAGWNKLEGTTTSPTGAPATVEMLANVDYTNGSGDFFGFLTLSYGDSSLTMRMDGEAVKNAATGVTAFSSELTVLGGSGEYNNATGSGEFTGSRDGALGSLAHIDVNVAVH